MLDPQPLQPSSPRHDHASDMALHGPAWLAGRMLPGGGK
jgi:hypothetical protein